MTTEPRKYKFKSVKEQKMYDIEAKLDIARQVIKFCLAKEYDVNLIQNSLVERASLYFPREIITQLLADVNTPKTFKNWSEPVECSPQFPYKPFKMVDNNTCYNDTILRQIIVDYYLVKKSLPTKEAILKTLNNNNISWNKHQLEICLKWQGYKSKRLPGCTKTIIVEDPENIFARIKYLQSIEQLRKSDVPLIYIENKTVTKKGLFLEDTNQCDVNATTFYLAASPSLGLISHKITKLSANTMHENNSILLSDWIVETVVPQLSTPSVFILEDNLCNPKFLGYVEMPTMHTSRNEMMKWLEQNDIPHDLNMHSAELFELIKKFNRHLLRRNVLVETLMFHGHNVLLRPRKTHYLNYYNLIRAKMLNLQNSLSLFTEISMINWKDLERILIEIEQKTINEDIAINKTIEQIFIYAEHEQISYDLIKNCDDDFDEFKIEEIVQIDA